MSFFGLLVCAGGLGGAGQVAGWPLLLPRAVLAGRSGGLLPGRKLVRRPHFDGFFHLCEFFGVVGHQHCSMRASASASTSLRRKR